MASWHKNLFTFLNGGRVRTVEQLSRIYGKSENHIRKVLAGRVITSLNHKRQYIASKEWVEKKADRYGFVEKHGRIFHKKGDIDSVLEYLARAIPWGIIQTEAKEKTGRDCSLALNELVRTGRLACAKVNGIKVYLHPKRIEIQLKNRVTNKRVCPEPRESDEDDIVLPLEDIITTFNNMVDQSEKGLRDLCIHLVRYYQQDTYRTIEIRLKLDDRIRKICNVKDHEIMDYSTICRHFNQIPFDDVKKIFYLMANELQAEKVITGKYLVIDSTHIFAWANTNKDTDVHGVDFAEWGEHQGDFYGYKVHIIIDAEAELPIAIKLTPGNYHDKVMYLPLVDEVTKNYDFEEIMAVFGDGAYYDEDLFRITEKELKCTLNAAMNPRRSKPLQKLKKKIREIFKAHKDEIHSVEDALRFIPQQTLTKYGADLGTRKESAIIGAIRERLNRHLRAAVERVFSRAKRFYRLERPRTKKFESVLKHIFMCFICMLLVALTATRKGLPGNKLKLAKVF